MKRDMDLVRDILVGTEASASDPRAWAKLDIPDRSQQEVSYHVQMMADAGLLVAQDLQSLGPDGYRFAPKRLTWQGHEFLDTIRDDEIWRRTKEGADRIGGFSLEILGALAKGFLREQVKKRTGLDIEI